MKSSLLATEVNPVIGGSGGCNFYDVLDLCSFQAKINYFYLGVQSSSGMHCSMLYDFIDR